MKITNPIHQPSNPQLYRRRTDAYRDSATSGQTVPALNTDKKSSTASPENKKLQIERRTQPQLSKNDRPHLDQSVKAKNIDPEKLHRELREKVAKFTASSGAVSSSINPNNQSNASGSSTVERVNARLGQIAVATYWHNQTLELRDSANEILGVDVFA